MEENQVKYYESANWAYIAGNYTPADLREIADNIEEKHKSFKEDKASK